MDIGRRWIARCATSVLGTAGLLGAMGCAPPSLEVSDLAALQRSLVEVRKPLDPEAMSRFDEALDFLVGGARPEEAEADPTLSPLILDIFRPLEGLTAEGVLTQAYITRARHVQSEIATLEASRAAAKAPREVLKGLRIWNHGVFTISKGFVEWPMLELRVENRTGHTVHLVRLRAVVLKPEEPEPWLMEEIDHLVYLGLEPDDRDLWRIEPKQHEWIQLVGAQPDRIFTVEPMRLATRGDVILAETDWGAAEAHRLAIYQRTLEIIRSTKTLALDRAPLPVQPTKSG